MNKAKMALALGFSALVLNLAVPVAAIAEDLSAYGFKVVDTSGQKPDWVTTTTQFAKGKKTYYVVSLTDQRKLETAKSKTMLRATAAIRDSIIQQISTKAGLAEETVENESESNGENDSSYKHESASRFNAVAIGRAIHLPGISEEGSYWELGVTKDNAGKIVRSYRVWTLVSIPTKILHKAQNEAANAALGQTTDEQTRKNLQDFLKENMEGAED